MTFEWDEKKNQANFQKHGIWFEEAQTVWSDTLAIEFFDPSHSSREDRFIRVGHSTGERLLFVVFCEKLPNRTLRIISSRKATLRERRQYEERVRSE